MGCSTSATRRAVRRSFGRLLALLIASYLATHVCARTHASTSRGLKVIDLRMPGIRPTKPDQYICRSLRLPERDAYIVGFVPHAEQHTVHHMLVFTCTEPGDVNNIWAPCVRTCASGRQIVYGWGMNAPSLELPRGVGMAIGPSTAARYLVMQLHYTDPEIVPPSGDFTGVAVHLSYRRPYFLAAIYLLVSDSGNIPAGQEAYNRDLSCVYRGPSTLYPMAFRVHAHRHAVQITGYRVRRGVWSVIGSESPQRPQAFYPVKNASALDIVPGDIIAARCTYNTTDVQTDLSIWMTREAEMCNFYMMFYSDSEVIDMVPRTCSMSVHGLNFSAAPRPMLLPLAGEHNHHHHAMSGMSSLTLPTAPGQLSTGHEAGQVPATQLPPATSLAGATTTAEVPVTSEVEMPSTTIPSTAQPQPTTPAMLHEIPTTASTPSSPGSNTPLFPDDVNVVVEETTGPVTTAHVEPATTEFNSTAAFLKVTGNRVVVIALIVVAMSFGALLSGAVVRHYQMMKRRNMWKDRFNSSGSRKCLMVDPQQKSDASLPRTGNGARCVKFHQLPVDQSSDSDSEDF